MRRESDWRKELAKALETGEEKNNEVIANEILIEKMISPAWTMVLCVMKKEFPGLAAKRPGLTMSDNGSDTKIEFDYLKEKNLKFELVSHTYSLLKKTVISPARKCIEITMNGTQRDRIIWNSSLECLSREPSKKGMAPFHSRGLLWQARLSTSERIDMDQLVGSYILKFVLSINDELPAVPIVKRGLK